MTVVLKRLAVLTGFLAALACLAGCLEFKKHTVVVRFGPNKELKCLLVYEGLHAGKKGTLDLIKAKNDLDSLVTNNRQFYAFRSFLGRVDLSPDERGLPEIEARKRRIRELITIHSGSFLLNEKNELCYYQTIDVSDRDALLAELNGAISFLVDELASGALRSTTEKSNGDQLSHASCLRLQDAARNRHDWLRLSPGRLVLQVPMTGEDADRALKGLREHRELLIILNAYTAAKSADGLMLSVGDGKAKHLRIEDTAEVQPYYEAELLAYAHTLSVPFNKSQDTKALMRTFERDE